MKLLKYKQEVLAFSMHWWLVCLALLAPFSGPSRLATLDGRVIQSATQEPVYKARVTLESTAPDHDFALVATTDETGQFRFADLQPGTYKLTVEKEEFLGGSYGQVDPADNQSNLKINADDRISGLTLRLFPQTVITGRVVDVDRDPVPDIEVCAWKRLHGVGGMTRFRVDVATTDHMVSFALAAYGPVLTTSAPVRRTPTQVLRSGKYL